MIQFYVPDILKTLTLPEMESGHCVRVLRMRAGQTLYCVDGAGTRYICRIVEPHAKHCIIEILDEEKIPNHWNFSITLCIAPPKNIDRMQWVVEKCVELGINEIIPVRCEHSERKELKVERLEKIAVSAMKQSLKGVLPRISPVINIQDALSRQTTGHKFICYCSDEVERKLLSKEYKPKEDVTIFIGPEGDFSPSEIQLAMGNGWQPVSLGDSRLRVETAAVFSVATVHTINQLSE